MADLRVPDLNTIHIAGRLTRDPELKYTQGGKAYCRLGIANTRYYKDAQGNRKEDTTFASATIWDKQAEYIGDKLRKGRPVLIEGSLKSYDRDVDGKKVTMVEIAARRVTPLDWDEAQGSGGAARPPAESSQQRQPAQQSFEDGMPLAEDDIPF